MEQKTGIAATISLIAAILSWIVTFTGHPIWGLLLALLSVPVGVMGLIMAASPRVSGGILSIIAIILGVIGLAIAILGIVGVIIF
jgi:hypothetical protein